MSRIGLVRGAGMLLAAAALSSGCSGSSSVPDEPFPPRPADLRMTGLLACDTLSDRQADELTIRDREPDILARGENSCSFGVSGARGWDVQMYPGISARSYVPDTPGYRGDEVGIRDPRVVTIAGYGAVELEYGPAEYTSNCSVVVDAAPDASFIVTYSDSSPEARSSTADSRPQRCAQASRAAEMVIATARARG